MANSIGAGKLPNLSGSSKMRGTEEVGEILVKTSFPMHVPHYLHRATVMHRMRESASVVWSVDGCSRQVRTNVAQLQNVEPPRAEAPISTHTNARTHPLMLPRTFHPPMEQNNQ